jgi:ParB family chromosome partitioning protein
MTGRYDPIRFSVAGRDAAVDRKKKLGKGLNALLGETRREEPVAQPGQTDTDAASDDLRSGALRIIPIASIVPLPGQPRTHFAEEALEQLAESIRARGVIQPIIVQPQGDTYRIVAGERRWRAAQKAQLHEIPAIVRELDQREVMALALIENLQREDLNPLEEARAYQRLADDEGMTQADIAKLVDKSRSHVANLQRLLSLPQEVQELVEQGQLSMGHARALVGYDGAQALAAKAVNDNLSVRDVEDAVRRHSAKPAKSRSAAKRHAAHDADIAAVETHLQDFLGMAIRIKAEADPRKGAITIQYRTLDQLDLICQRLTGGDL